MATITSAGIGSGLDIESLLSKLVASERAPITQLKTRTDTLKTQLSSFGKVQSAMAAMRDAVAKLTRPDTWGAALATSSDAASVTATAGTGAAVGNVSVSVTKLATSQTLASGVLPTSPATVGQGQITIELGTWDAGQTTFTSKAGTTPVTITINPGEDQLAQIRDKINASGAGVVASIITDASGSKLVMRSKDTGESNGFRVSVGDADGINNDASGLSALAFDPTAGITSMTQKVAAGNAQAKLNNIDINAESNTLTEAIDGLTITLLKPTTSDVTLTVGQDKEAIKKSINDFVTAYNALTSLFRDQTKYDAANKTGAPLQGDSTVIGLQAEMRGIAAGSTTLGGTLNRLADIGLDPGNDGQLKVSTTKLDAAFGNLENLKQLFMGIDSGNAENNGLGQRLRAFGDIALSMDGRLSSRQTGLQSRISGNDKRSAELEDRVALIEKRLRARYTALDTQMAQLNGLSTYVSQQMNLINKS